MARQTHTTSAFWPGNSCKCKKRPQSTKPRSRTHQQGPCNRSKYNSQQLLTTIIQRACPLCCLSSKPEPSAQAHACRKVSILPAEWIDACHGRVSVGGSTPSMIFSHTKTSYTLHDSNLWPCSADPKRHHTYRQGHAGIISYWPKSSMQPSLWRASASYINKGVSAMLLTPCVEVTFVVVPIIFIIVPLMSSTRPLAASIWCRFQVKWYVALAAWWPAADAQAAEGTCSVNTDGADAANRCAYGL